jgi:UDP-N-acetyl-2-amino-2-deoxyglucuronate dehydrogenase
MPHNFAIVGCGNVSARHAAAIQQVGTLVAVCDPETLRAQELARSYGCKVFSNVEELLRNCEAGIISVCSPSGFHAPHAIQALSAGRHVLCEKPMAITSLSAKEMIRAAKHADRRLLVVKQNRYNPPVQLLKQLISEGKLGDIHSFQVNCFWNRNNLYYQNSGWRGKQDVDGGTLFTQFSHFVDLLYWLFGPLREARGWRGNFSHRESVEFEDTGVANLLMENGTIGSLHYTINAHQRNLEGSIIVFGSKGTIKVGGVYLNRIEYFSIDGEQTDQWLSKIPETVANPHLKVYHELVKTLDDPQHPFVDAEEACRSVEMIEEIYRNSPMVT